MAANELLDWIVNESQGLTEGRMEGIPDIATLQKLTDDKNNKIWKYVTKYVKSKQSVVTIKRVLKLKEESERKKNEGLELKRQIESQLDSNSRYDSIILCYKLEKANEKVAFEEICLKSITNDILCLKHKIQEIKENNCIMLQNCSFLQMAVLKFQEKNILLKTILEKLTLLINETIKLKKDQYFHELVMIPSAVSGVCINLQLIKKLIKSCVCQLSSAVERELSEEEEKKCTISCITSLNKIRSNISIVQFVTVLKVFTKKSANLLRERQLQIIDVNPEERSDPEEIKPYNKYAQIMERDLIESSFNRKIMLNELSALKPSYESLQSDILKTDTSETAQKVLRFKIQNEGLEESINFLEKVLSDEREQTKYLVEDNDKTRHECNNLKTIMQDFHSKLQAIITFQKTSQIKFNNITKALISSNAYSYNYNLSSESDDYFSNVKDNIYNDYESSLAVVKSKHFRKSLYIPVLNRNILSSEQWNLLNIRNFQNCSLLIEKLTNIKLEMLNQDVIKFSWKNDKEKVETFITLSNKIKGKIEELKQAGEQFKTSSEESNKNLKIALDEWWNQKAQFIPKIIYDRKSLKMWLDILLILDDGI